MKFLHAFAVGIIREDAKILKTPKGEPYLETVVEMEQRAARNGGPYSQRVVFRSFLPGDIERAPKVRRGSTIVIEGNTDAIVTHHEGKAYANNRVTGRIMQLQEAVA